MRLALCFACAKARRSSRPFSPVGLYRGVSPTCLSRVMKVVGGRPLMAVAVAGVRSRHYRVRNNFRLAASPCVCCRLMPTRLSTIDFFTKRLQAAAARRSVLGNACAATPTAFRLVHWRGDSFRTCGGIV